MHGKAKHTAMTTESPLDRICRRAAEHERYVLSHPAEFSRSDVERAALSAYQHERLSVASILRYGD